MKFLSKSFVCFLLMVCLIHLQKIPAFSAQEAEENMETEPAEISEVREPAEPSTLITLNIIITSVKGLEGEIRDREKALRKAGTKEQQIRIVEEIDALNQKIDVLEKDFDRIASGVDSEAFESGPSEEFRWQEEVQELLGPVIRELKNMTARPRQIEKLRTEVSYYRDLLPVIDRAVFNIRRLVKQTSKETLKKKLDALAEDWENRKKQIESELAVAAYQLEEKTKEKRSLFESTQNIALNFFKTRGKNFFIAVFTFFAVLILFRFCHRLIYRYSPVHKTGKRSFYVRLGDVIYQFLTVIGATGAMLITLYMSGDWVLLSIAIIFILGIVWTARQGIPRFWEQIKLLLNLGAVREGERVIYNGIPWRVQSINLYCHLENPELKIGKIRLPLKELIELKSRPHMDFEPWFPCRVGDWVILSDETFGRVTVQTPEMVRMVLRGGNVKTYQTPDFLSLCPDNLTTNFRIRVIFGVDYGHQAVSTELIPEMLFQIIADRMRQTEYGHHLLNLRVEFCQAGASSLDLMILADFSGKAAEYYRRLTRLLQRFAVDACNRHGWVIPFTQLTLHQADAEAGKKAEAEAADYLKTINITKRPQTGKNGEQALETTVAISSILRKAEPEKEDPEATIAASELTGSAPEADQAATVAIAEPPVRDGSLDKTVEIDGGDSLMTETHLLDDKGDDMPVPTIPESRPSRPSETRPSGKEAWEKTCAGREAASQEKDRYQLKERLFTGGMGEILKVTDKYLKRNNAMKVILSDLKDDPESFDSFIREAKITGFLEHPNIIPVHELGKTCDTGVYFTMKLASGETLRMILENIRREDAPFYSERYNTFRLLDIFRQVCNAIAFAHSRKIIHQDIKPDNIMVGEYGEVLVMDWGVSRYTGEMDSIEDPTFRDLVTDIMDGADGEQYNIKGSPAYMSPEQAAGHVDMLDECTDVFLLGATLYHMFTLTPPYMGRSIDDTLRKARVCDFDPPDIRNPHRQIPPEICRIIMKAMAFRKEKRYQNVLELCGEIDDLISGQWSPQQRKTFQPGEMLIREGEKGEEAYMILSGKVRVYKTAKDRQVDLSLLNPGNIIGEMALITDETRSASIEAVEETEVAVITKGNIRQNLKRLPPYMEKIVSALTERLRSANTIIIDHFDE